MCRQQICVSNSSQGLTPLGCMRCSLNIPGHPIIAKKKLRKLPSNEIEKTATSDDFISNHFPIGGRHHQNYKDLKQISIYKSGLRISCRIEQLIKEWHGQILDSLVFLRETEHPKHGQFSQMINGLVVHVELEHEIVKWTCSITNSLALICNTVHKRFSVASNGTV